MEGHSLAEIGQPIAPGETGAVRMLKCSSCREVKPETEFHFERNTKRGRAWYCKECQRQRHKRKPQYPREEYVDLVYFIRCSDMLKIGRWSGHPDALLPSYKTKCPYPIELVATYWCNNKEHAKVAEREFQDIFTHRHSHGEWFHLDDNLIGVTT